VKRYPCTGHVELSGFSDYLGKELGPSRHNLRAFTRELASRFDAPKIVLTNSGSSANLAAAFALREAIGAKQTPRALIAGFTFPTTAAALLTAGFDVFVCDTDGFAIDPAAVARAMTPDVAVVCATHFLGFAAPVDRLSTFGPHLLQDACETMDAFVGDRRVHAHGAITTWSFYHPHHLSAYGGGAVIVDSAELQRLLESLTHWGRACTCHVPGLVCTAPHGRDHNFWYERIGFNLEMSELNACFGRWQLARFDRDEAQRKRNYAILHDAIAGTPGVTVWPLPRNSGSPFVFPLALDEPSRVEPLCAALAEDGVEARSLMGGAITRHPAYAHLPNDGLARCRDLSARAFFVGVHQTLPEDDVRAVAHILRRRVADVRGDGKGRA
jgi:CDP-6-deoxy-D-xylo-4-hexulose-3-dehydrase